MRKTIVKHEEDNWETEKKMLQACWNHPLVTTVKLFSDYESVMESNESENDSQTSTEEQDAEEIVNVSKDSQTSTKEQDAEGIVNISKGTSVNEYVNIIDHTDSCDFEIENKATLSLSMRGTALVCS
ncbi:hypothetical protein TKK_0014291 [Trichogramma kaykai]